MTAASLLLACAAGAAFAQDAPPGFEIDNVTPSVSWAYPTCLAFLPDGRWLVGEKGGTLWIVSNGVRNSTPLWDHQNEVNADNDRGLLSVAVDPNYFVNHFIYLLYTVDPDSDGVDNDPNCFGRLTRYQISFTDSTKLVTASRTILMGTSFSDSPIEVSPSHSIGCLRFARDGSLLVSAGDGANFNQVDTGGLDPDAFGPGLAPSWEDIGALRSQDINNLDGKILRVNPTNGHGYASNPYYDGNASSVRSRVWAYGFRNPFRFAIKPGTGSTNPADGNPGELFSGDVGWNTYEELNWITSGGGNYGWPCKEGLLPQPEYDALPSHGLCDSLGTPSNPATQYSDAIMVTHHSTPSLSTPPGFIGNCCVGGQWYTGTLYPAIYQNRLFIMDFGQNVLRLATLDGTGHVSAMSDFVTNMVGPVDLEVDPATGDLIYVAIYQGQIKRIRWTSPAGDTPPVAQASASPPLGLAPLAVNFSSAGSVDADNDPLAFSWDFGDQSGSTLANPSHTYNIPGDYTATLTVTDGRGGQDTHSLQIHVAIPTPFPSTGVLDEFARPDGALGGNWTLDTGAFTISSGQAQVSGDGSVILSTPVLGNVQEAWVDFAAVDNLAPEQDLLLMVQGTDWTTGAIKVRYDAGAGGFLVDVYDPNTGWIGHSPLMPATVAPGDRVGARADSSGLVVVYKNGAVVGSANCADWPYRVNGGRVGLAISGATLTRYERFGGGNAVLNANTPPVVHINHPDSVFVVVGDTLTYKATASDLQQADSTLTWFWATDLHHNTHIHPGVITSTADSLVLPVENHDDGTGIYWLTYVRVTDSGNLSASDTTYAFPEVDLSPYHLALQPATPSDVVSVTFQFWLRNAGRMPAPYTHWQMTLDGSTIAQGDTLVAAQDSVLLKTTVQPLAQGTHVVHVAADTLHGVYETNEANNDTTLTFDVVAPILGTTPLPRVLSLSQAMPTPAAGAVSLALEMPRDDLVEVRITDVQGRTIWSESPGTLSAGRWMLRWDGSLAGGRAPAGVYLARVRVGPTSFLRRIVLVR